ncbi:MAG: YeeE/YedE family protein [Polyangiaceae bacterium]|jgi:uncharacterized membrane protein YedE/YeeE|nr:YeeE/YedE family protein [Polyangiaceae bacterium]
MQFQLYQAGWSLLGGAIVGAASVLYLATHGRVAGISGIVSGVLERTPDWRPRLAFVGGLVAAGLLLARAVPSFFGASPVSLGLIVAAGLLVGFGTKLGNGCTSGHGVCGMSRRSPRSFAATLTFIATGAVTVAAMRHLGGS